MADALGLRRGAGPAVPQRNGAALSLLAARIASLRESTAEQRRALAAITGEPVPGEPVSTAGASKPEVAPPETSEPAQPSEQRRVSPVLLAPVILATLAAFVWPGGHT